MGFIAFWEGDTGSYILDIFLPLISLPSHPPPLYYIIYKENNRLQDLRKGGATTPFPPLQEKENYQWQ